MTPGNDVDNNQNNADQAADNAASQSDDPNDNSETAVSNADQAAADGQSATDQASSSQNKTSASDAAKDVQAGADNAGPGKGASAQDDTKITDKGDDMASGNAADVNDAADAEQNDMDRAVEAEVNAAGTGTDDDKGAEGSQSTSVSADAESASNDADPLGFGNARMDGDGEPASEVEVLQAQLVEAESKAAAHWDQLLRLQAEMENQRKRAQNDVTKARKFALEGIANDILPVKDSLEMGLAAATAEDADPTKIVEGTEMTLKMLAQALEKYNIVEINPIDEKFDPEFHQAMSMQPVEGKEPNTVSSVLQKGYTLNDRLIRPALVMVVK